MRDVNSRMLKQLDALHPQSRIEKNKYMQFVCFLLSWVFLLLDTSGLPSQGMVPPMVGCNF